MTDMREYSSKLEQSWLLDDENIMSWSPHSKIKKKQNSEKTMKNLEEKKISLCLEHVSKLHEDKPKSTNPYRPDVDANDNLSILSPRKAKAKAKGLGKVSKLREEVRHLRSEAHYLP